MTPNHTSPARRAVVLAIRPDLLHGGLTVAARVNGERIARHYGRTMSRAEASRRFVETLAPGKN